MSGVLYSENQVLASGRVYLCTTTNLKEGAAGDINGTRRLHFDLGNFFVGPPTPEQINDVSFGVTYAVKSTPGARALVDEIALAVQYITAMTPPGSPVPSANTTGDAYLSVASSPAGVYVLVGDAGRIKRTTSADLRAQNPPGDVTFVDPATSTRFTSVVWTGKGFFACGAAGQLWRSDKTGSIWFKFSTVTLNDLLGLCNSPKQGRVLFMDGNGFVGSARYT